MADNTSKPRNLPGYDNSIVNEIGQQIVGNLAGLIDDDDRNALTPPKTVNLQDPNAPDDVMRITVRQYNLAPDGRKALTGEFRTAVAAHTDLVQMDFDDPDRVANRLITPVFTEQSLGADVEGRRYEIKLELMEKGADGKYEALPGYTHDISAGFDPGIGSIIRDYGGNKPVF